MEIITMETMTANQLLEHWQGHRGLTRKVIEAFPEEEFFRFSIGGMRPFAELAWEMLSIAAPGMQGIVTGEWPALGGNGHRYETDAPKTKAGFLEKWDESTVMLNCFWPELPQARFQETVMAFGQYEGTVFSTIMYFIDNEIHHRGQGYVYLRALGIEPPAFWDRNL
jgi:uncharacterized damage-inducible protein DinB